MSAWPEITPEQIIARLQMIVAEPESLCKTDLHYIEDAADEIERLRAELVRSADELAATVRELRKVQDERDEARRENCRMAVDLYVDESLEDETLEDAAMIIAERKGWHCFKENKR